MNRDLRKAFTVIELIFVIVVIGILSAIALPRFSDTADNAYLSKAQSEIMAVRSALSTERQKRILRGDTTTSITSLSCTSSSCPATPTYAFDHFSADRDGNYNPVIDYPVKACASNTQKACWKVGSGGGSTTYSYQFIEGGEAVFVLSNNRLDCQSGDETDCQKITQ